ncbi:HmuY family protein [Pedobacter sp. NJ-S-72]
MKTRNAIGTKWRTISIGLDKDLNKVQIATVNSTLFYVIKDAEGNVYKLRFKSAGTGGDGGANGRPVIEYRLLQSAPNPSSSLQ